MITTDEVTTGEVTRSLGKVEAALTKLTEEVKKNPDWDDLRRTEAALTAQILAEEKMRKAERITADKAIKSLEDWNKWALRTVGGLVLAAVATATLTGGVPGV